MANTGLGQRLPLGTSPQNSQFERILNNAARFGIVLIACVVAFVAIDAAQVLLAPVFIAVTIGLMFGPLADRFERVGVPPGLSAGMVVILFIVLLAMGMTLFAVPLSEWVARIPAIWEKLRGEAMALREPLSAIATLQNQVREIVGGGATMSVTVDSGNPVTDIALQAPALFAQILVFLVSLYFFLATRHQIRAAALSVCVTRRMRWRTAHVFRDVETKVSRFLLSVTVINFCVGVAVTLAMWAAGMPSPVLWGALAALVNYIPYVAQAVMVTVLFVVALGTQQDLVHVLLPVGLYLVISFSEGQVITPQILGRTLTLNPFLVFLSIGFWIWVWGPVGGLVAVPSLLMLTSFLEHVLPRGVDEEAPIPARVRARVVREAAEEIAAKRREEEESERRAEEAKLPEEAPPAEPAPEKPTRRRSKGGSSAAPAAG
ncbi:AI-2E family transporter [Youhaiella tibetensis]|nr:AI-2E family transporter [Youhaiella tibetensis]